MPVFRFLVAVLLLPLSFSDEKKCSTTDGSCLVDEAGWHTATASAVPLCSSGVINIVDAQMSSKSEAVEQLKSALQNLTAPLVVRGLLPDQKGAFSRDRLKQQLADYTITPKSALLTGALGPERDASSGDSITRKDNFTFPAYLDAMRDQAGGEHLPEIFENTRSSPALVQAYEANLALGPLRSAAAEFFGDSSFQVLSLGGHGEGLPFHAHNKAMLVHIHGGKVWHWLKPSYLPGKRLVRERYT